MPSENLPSNDALFQSSRRELKWIVIIWAVTFAWVITYCRLFGYSSGEPVELTLGIPSWAFWGVFAPWGIATGVSCWFALTKMQDHPLNADVPETQTETTDA